MSSKPFHYQAPFPFRKDDTEYCLLTSEHVSVSEFEGRGILKVAPKALTLLVRQAFHDTSFILRPTHQQQVTNILRDPKASENDKYVALQFPRNPDIAVRGVLPTCQGTGIAIIVGKKGQRVWTGGGDEAALARSVYNTYIENNLCYSQDVPLDMYKKVNTGTSLSAQTDLYAVDGDEYKFLYITKGGGPANKTCLYQKTKVLLTPGKLKNYLAEKVRMLGTAACPPYRIVFVIDGTPAEANLKTVKLVSAEYYDELSTEGNEHSQAFRDMELEKELLVEARNLSLGVQFGGRYFVHDIRVICLPRYGVSRPVGIGVFRPTGRNIRAKIDRQGIWIEKLEHNPGEYIPEGLRKAGEGEVVCVDLSHPAKEILTQLLQYPVSTRLSFNGTIIVDRDIAHAKPRERIDNGEGLSQYIKDHPIYYAGPAKAPEGYTSGFLDPTTAERMDSCADQLQAQGGSMIMLVRGNRSQQATDVCKKRDGFYPGSIGGPAAVLVQGDTKSLECVEYPELGMEAIWKIEMEDFPAFILVDDRGNDFFQQVQPTQCTRCVKQTEPPFGAIFLCGTKGQAFVIKW